MLQEVPETSGVSFETPLTRLLRMRAERVDAMPVQDARPSLTFRQPESLLLRS
jgi:hypothetical protein